MQFAEHRLSVSVDKRVGGSGEFGDLVRSLPGLTHRKARFGNCRPHIGAAFREFARQIVDVGKDARKGFLVLVVQNLGQPVGERRKPFHQLRGIVEQCAKTARARWDHWSASGAFLRDFRRTFNGTRKLNLIRAGKARLLNARRGAEQDGDRVLD